VVVGPMDDFGIVGTVAAVIRPYHENGWERRDS